LVGQSNKLAFGAVKALLESPEGCPPVFVHGSCGVGKTHLLRAAAQRYRQIVPGSKVRYITGEAFTNSFVQAVRTKTMDLFEKKFRRLDVLCLDDVHLVAGKEGTQHELLQIFNTLSLSGAKVIIASDAPPNEIARLHTGLASRFNGGVVARIDTPNRDLGLRMARQICLGRGMMIEDAGLGAILDRTGVGNGASVRELEGAIVQVQAVARLLDQDQNGAPTLTSIHRALQLRCGSGQSAQSKGPIPIELITRVVLEHLGVTRQDLGGRGRHRTVVLARELIVHLSRELTTHSFPEIAHAIGRPNHSTVITAAKRIRGRIENLELCVAMGPESGVTVKGLAEELTERVRMTHRQRGERV
jgi:chromosomal replication initiator protein